MSNYLWYSFGSDVGGPKLAEALGFTAGKKTPNFSAHDVVLGWGCKPGTKYDSQALAQLIEKREVRILNHPDAVDSNRRKFGSLEKLRDAGVMAPGFLSTDGLGRTAAVEAVCQALKDGVLDFPVLGLRHDGKGGVDFCYTAEDVIKCLTGSEGGKGRYFRSFCPGTEFRLHTFRDRVFDAEVKALAENPLDACAASLRKKLEKKAKAEKVELASSPKEIGWMIEALSGDLLTGPSHIQRSVNHGWAYQEFPVVDVTAKMAATAMAALEALQLDLGAVSMVVEGGFCTVTGVTTAPALTDERTEKYVSEIKEFCKAVKAPEKKGKTAKEKSATEEEAPKELVAKIRRQLSKLSRKKAEKVLKSLED